MRKVKRLQVLWSTANYCLNDKTPGRMPDEMVALAMFEGR